MHHSATFAAKQLRDDVDAIEVLTAGLHILAQDIECFEIGNHRLFADPVTTAELYNMEPRRFFLIETK